MSVSVPVDLGLQQLVGRDLLAFVLVLGRVGPLFLLAPVLSSTMLPIRVKFMVAAAIAVAITPVADSGQTVPAEPLAFAIGLLHEVAVGLALALALGLVVAAIQAGAALLDTLAGFSLGGLVDPITGNQNAIVGQVYSLFAAMIFVVAGGVQLMIAGVARSYDLVPLTSAPAAGRLAALATRGLETVPLIGLELVAPVLFALVVTDVSFGLLGRAVPQMNVLALGLPAKVLVTFACVAASLPFLANHLQDTLTESLSRALTAFQP